MSATDFAAALSDTSDDPRLVETIAELIAREGSTDLDSIVAAVLDRSAPDPGGGSEPEPWNDVAARLHHCWLPKLDDAGLITYDPGDKRVTECEIDLENVVGDESARPLPDPLADPVRRAVLSALVGNGGTLSFEDLVEAVRSATGRTDVKRLRIELHHEHLPRLAEAGFVSHGRERVELDSRAQ